MNLTSHTNTLLNHKQSILIFASSYFKICHQLEIKLNFIKSGKYSTPYLILFYFLIWILLSEILLPVNQVIPKPSIVLLAFGDLIYKYQLGLNYLSTVTAIYLPLLLSYYFCKIVLPVLLKENIFTSVILSFEWFSRYIPGIILAMILIYWFPQSDLTKFMFAFLISFTSLMFRTKHLAEGVEPEYILGLQSFGILKTFAERIVIWKAIQPNFLVHIIKQNLYLWASVIMFEFVNLGLGLGTILRKVLMFRDLSALVMLFLIIGTSIFIITQSMNFVKNKFYFWKA